MVRKILMGFIDPMNIMIAFVLAVVLAVPIYYWQRGAAHGEVSTIPITNQDVQVRDDDGSVDSPIVPEHFETFLAHKLPRSFISRPVIRGDVLDVENEPADAGDFYGIACYDRDQDMTVRNQETGEPIAAFVGLHMYAFARYQMPLPLDAYYEDLSKIEFCETIAYKSSGQSTGYQTAASYFWTLPPGAVQLAQTLSKSADQ